MMKLLKCLTACILCVVLTFGFAASSLASESQVTERRLRVYSSLDQSRHEITVTEFGDKVYAAADELAALFHGNVSAASWIDGVYSFLEEDTKVNTFLKDALSGVGLTKGRQTHFAITNGVTQQILKYDLLTKTWLHVDAAYEQDVVYTQLSTIGEPIIDGERVFVEFLPAAKALGGIVNTVKKGDGVALYIPRATSGSLLQDVRYIMYQDSGFAIPYYTGGDDSMDFTDAALHSAAVILDTVGDILSDKMGSFLSGQYNADLFRDVILGIGGGKNSPDSELFNQLWEEQKYIIDLLGTDAGLEIRFQLNNDCQYFYENLFEYPDIVEIYKLSDPVTDAAGKLLPSAMDNILSLYSYHQKILSLETSAMEAIVNVYDTHGHLLYDKEIDDWGRSISDIAKGVADDYYGGLSAKDILRTMSNYTIDMIRGFTLSADPVAGLTTAVGLPLKTGDLLAAANIGIGISENLTGYEFGSYNYESAMRSIQSHLKASFADLFSDARNDMELLQLLCDGAEIFGRVKFLYNDYTSPKALEAYDRVTADISDAAFSDAALREQLSHITNAEVKALVFDNISGEFDFHAFAEALGLVSWIEDGGSAVSSWSMVTDLDGDGYVEYLMGYSDGQTFSNLAWYVFDADAGIVDTCTAGSYADVIQNGDSSFSIPSVVYDPVLDAMVICVKEMNTVYGIYITDYVRWTGTCFEDYLYASEDMNYGDWYTVNGQKASEKQFKEREKLVGSKGSEGKYELRKINAGSDHIQKTFDMLEALKNIVPVTVASYPDFSDEEVSLIQYCSSFRYNADRTIMEVTVEDTVIAEQQHNTPWISLPRKYYYTTDGSLVKEYVETPNAVSIDYEHEAWLELNGF